MADELGGRQALDRERNRSTLTATEDTPVLIPF
jgi:hypothetical protein